jgi:prophage maintenance system killer protein
LRRPDLALAIAINHSTRAPDEWFDEPDDLDRVAAALRSIDVVEDVVEAADVLMFRVARAQGFGEGNKRTAFLLARWLLDRNDRDGSAVMPADDRQLADLLVRAASGQDVEADIVAALKRREQ